MNLGIYIQVPFCQTKCTYCNFHTGPAARSSYAPYARAVERELAQHRSLYAAAGIESAAALDSTTVDTIYLGGGTPSLLDPADLPILGTTLTPAGIVDAHSSCDSAATLLVPSAVRGGECRV